MNFAKLPVADQKYHIPSHSIPHLTSRVFKEHKKNIAQKFIYMFFNIRLIGADKMRSQHF